MAPVWAHRADRRGRRALMRLGLYGFIVSMLICGGALAAGLAGMARPRSPSSPSSCSGARSTARSGSASPPAVQAYIAARTEGEQRTNALAAIASSFGLGTIIGPAIAPLFIFPPLGLSGPLIVFAAIGVARAGRAGRCACPTTRRAAPARGPIVAYPSIGGSAAAQVASAGEAVGAARAGAIRGSCPGT